MALAPSPLPPLPPIQASTPIVEPATGRASVPFFTWWQNLIQAIRANFDAIEAQVVAIQAAIAAAAAASSKADTVATQPFVTTELNALLPNAKVLMGSLGVTLDQTVPNQVAVDVNALTILNANPIALSQPVTASNGFECNTLKVDQTAFASVTASDHSIPIDCNGTVYYMRLSTAP